MHIDRQVTYQINNYIYMDTEITQTAIHKVYLIFTNIDEYMDRWMVKKGRPYDIYTQTPVRNQ